MPWPAWINCAKCIDKLSKNSDNTSNRLAKIKRRSLSKRRSIRTQFREHLLEPQRLPFRTYIPQATADPLPVGALGRCGVATATNALTCIARDQMR